MERLNENRLGAARLWRDPSVRRLSLWLTGLFVVVAISVWLFAYLSAERMKADWIDEQTELIGKLALTDPDKAEEWARALAGSLESPASKAAIEEGQRLVSRYGITPAIDSRMIPASHSYYTRTLAAAGLGAVIFAMLAAIIMLRESRRGLIQISRLARSVEDTVKHNKPMAFRLYGEGELGLLANSVQELAIRLQETIEQLEQDKTFLKNMVADISHQLKTPLASLIIYVDLLREGKTDSVSSAEFLDTCRRELDRMEWLTLTLLKLARMEAGALDMQMRTGDLADTLRKAIEPTRRLAEERAIDISVVEPEEPIYCPHDSHWLAEALQNVIKNAIEHSPAHSRVTIRSEQTSVFIRITVTDSGQGIDERHLPHIFKKFYRASRGGSGVGLGLPLARIIAEKHGGLLSARANAGEGSTFTLTLPANGSVPFLLTKL
ncbi:sensor histidine kinase [Cohnella faecalis]|uniref:histidine kinase n=1 Tax=Cohnella faecalis TaxID=2315694 RepID=A0A398CP10_9BACL|nr:HAMP domain-containing sensor histidine kinase [Cohnella faecalis]RIE01271.1 sensor histidine kinase [Cohnella faecalis]